MTTTETISVTELEEMLSDELPCGGNRFPEVKPCPHSAPATLVNTHRCKDGLDAKDFKCFDCYRVWATAVCEYSFFIVCHKCGRRVEALGLYRPL